MSEFPVESNRESLSAAEAEQIRRACLAYEERLAIDPDVRPLAFADRVPANLRGRLIEALVARHAAHRRSLGEDPFPEDYPELEGCDGDGLTRSAIVSGDAHDDAERPRFQLPIEEEPIGSSDSTALGAILPEAMDAEGAPLDAGMRVGRYDLLEKLGRGGFAEVWRARDTELGQDVALKLPRKDRPLKGAAIDQFKAEARRQAGLRGVPGVVTVYDVGESVDGWYIVSELIEGETLQARMPSLTREERLRIVASVARTLDAAHHREVVHRDVKPQNILLDREGKAYVADFGIAATRSELAGEPGRMVIGTYAYMSPEQVTGDSWQATPQSDVYSLGVVLYAALTGKRPIEADGLSTMRRAIVEQPPWPPRSHDRTIPEELEQICLRCLAKNPAERFSSAGDVAAAIEQILERDSVTPSSATRPVWRTAAAVAVMGLVLLGVTIWGTQALRSGSSGPKVAEPVGTDPPVVTGGSDTGEPEPGKSDEIEEELLVRPLVFGPEDSVTWDAIEDGAGLRVVSESVCLLKLGVLETGGDLTLEFQLRKLAFDGRVGTFFALDESRFPKNAPFQVVELYERDDRTLKLYAKRIEIPGGDVRATQVSRLTESQTEFKGSETHGMALAIRKGEVVRVEFSGLGLGGFPVLRRESLLKRGFSLDSAGTFGIYCQGGAVAITNVFVDGKPIRFVRHD